jgi:hypothetical protein
MHRIDTAPRDGTRILAMNNEYGLRETYWRFFGEGSLAKASADKGEGPNGAWDWTEPMHNWAGPWEPTHWTPLPLASRSEILVAGLTLIGCGFAAGVIFVAAIVWVAS